MFQLKSHDRPPLVLTAYLADRAAQMWRFPPTDFYKRDRTRRLAFARFAVAYALREVGITLTTIADVLGFKDHSTVIYALKRVREMRDEDPQFRHRSDVLADMARDFKDKAKDLEWAA